MEASAAFVEEFGERTGNQMLWATYAGAYPQTLTRARASNPNP